MKCVDYRNGAQYIYIYIDGHENVFAFDVHVSI